MRARLGNVLSWQPKNFLATIAITLALVLPLGISALYMWAMWDPSPYVPHVPLAIVNNDKGADKDGKHENFGDTVAKGLLDTSYLHFQQVNPDEAKQGLLKDKYLFTVTIPEDFSSNIMTVMGPKPTQAKIDIAYNNYNGSAGAFVSNSLVPQLQNQVASNISKTYAEEIIGGLNDMGNGLKDASKGSTQLKDGATELKSGTGQLKDGSNQLVAGNDKLVQGANRLAGGGDQLSNGTDQLAGGMAQIDDGVAKLNGELIPLAQKARVLTQLRPAVDALRAVGQVQQANQLEEAINGFDPSKPGNMESSLNQLKAGTAKVRNELSNPQAQYRGGVEQLRSGIHELQGGATQLNQGQHQLNDGIVKLDAGAVRLQDGTVQLSDGLNAGAEKAQIASNLNDSSRQVSAPILLSDTNYHPAQTQVSQDDPTKKVTDSGASLQMLVAVGFLLMALIAVILPASLGRRRTALVMPAIGSWIANFALNFGILSLLAMYSKSLGWHPAGAGQMLTVILLMAAAGASSYLFLRTMFGRLIGGIACVAVFMLGLFSFGGIWPLSTTPALFRAFHSFTPMTYARYAFIRATDGIYDSTYRTGILGLLVFAVLGFLLTLLVRYFKLAATHANTVLNESDAVNNELRDAERYGTIEHEAGDGRYDYDHHQDEYATAQYPAVTEDAEDYQEPGAEHYGAHAAAPQASVSTLSRPMGSAEAEGRDANAYGTEYSEDRGTSYGNGYAQRGYEAEQYTAAPTTAEAQPQREAQTGESQAFGQEPEYDPWFDDSDLETEGSVDTGSASPASESGSGGKRRGFHLFNRKK